MRFDGSSSRVRLLVGLDEPQLAIFDRPFGLGDVARRARRLRGRWGRDRATECNGASRGQPAAAHAAARSLACELLVFLAGRRIAGAVDAVHVADRFVDLALVLDFDANLGDDFALLRRAPSATPREPWPEAEPSAFSTCSARFELRAISSFKWSMSAVTPCSGRSGGGSASISSDFCRPFSAIGRLEGLARVFFRLVALVFGELAVVVGFVEIALTERLALLGVVELASSAW